MNLANEAVDACTEIALYLEKWLEEAEVHQLGLPLEVFVIVPFDNRVFQLTHSICIAEYFQYPIFDISLLSIIVICEDCISCWIS